MNVLLFCGICKLNKAICGLKQDPKCWNEEFHNYIKPLGFKSLNSDTCLYIQIRNAKKHMLIICFLYVDDLLRKEYGRNTKV